MSDLKLVKNKLESVLDSYEVFPCEIKEVKQILKSIEEALEIIKGIENNKKQLD